jgi:hypothetical protein
MSNVQNARYKLVNTKRDNERYFESRDEAEAQREELIGLDEDPDALKVVSVDDTASNNGANTTDVHDDSDPAIPAPDVSQDPVEWMPAHFVDTINGVPVVNRKGYAVIAHEYGVSVTAEPVTLASETDWEYAEFRAVAETADGQTYSGFGSAHVDREDGDDRYVLNELAETRALKRSCAWATGVGMSAIEEMQGDPDG